MTLPRVLIVNRTFPNVGLEILKAKTIPEVLPYYDHDAESLLAIKRSIQGCDALVWNTKHRLTGEILDLAGPRLKAVTTMASGYDHVDVGELATRRISFGNTPHVLNNAVADIAVGLLIGAARRFKEGIRELESGNWKYGVQWKLGQDIAGSTVGTIGLGGIGQAVVRRLKGFDVAKFLYCGNTDKPEAKTLNVERVTQEQLLRESDYVVLSCPLTPNTKHLINAATLKMMKCNAVLVNIGRGGLIDQEALYISLKEGEIFAAGLDVTTPEPLPNDHPLVSLPNCLTAMFGRPERESSFRIEKAVINFVKIVCFSEAFHGKWLPLPMGIPNIGSHQRCKKQREVSFIDGYLLCCYSTGETTKPKWIRFSLFESNSYIITNETG